MKTWTVYMLTCTETGDIVYIGRSTQIITRLTCHLHGKRCRFPAAFFDASIVAEELAEYESYLLEDRLIHKHRHTCVNIEGNATMRRLPAHERVDWIFRQ